MQSAYSYVFYIGKNKFIMGDYYESNDAGIFLYITKPFSQNVPYLAILGKCRRKNAEARFLTSYCTLTICRLENDNINVDV